MRTSRQRQTRQRRVSRRVNAWILGGYVGIAALAAALKAWQTAFSSYPVGWLAKTNVIIWDTITLAAALGALALGVREMVLAYFIRKEYEEDLDALLQNQREQAEMVKVLLDDARQQREAEAVRSERDAALIQQLLEQNRLLLEHLDRQSNGHNPESPN